MQDFFQRLGQNKLCLNFPDLYPIIDWWIIGPKFLPGPEIPWIDFSGVCPLLILILMIIAKSTRKRCRVTFLFLMLEKKFSQPKGRKCWLLRAVSFEEKSEVNFRRGKIIFYMIFWWHWENDDAVKPDEDDTHFFCVFTIQLQYIVAPIGSCKAFKVFRKSENRFTIISKPSAHIRYRLNCQWIIWNI